jgi:hypothetical protein
LNPKPTKILNTIITERDKLTHPNCSAPMLCIRRGMEMIEIKTVEDWISARKRKFWRDLFRIKFPKGTNRLIFSNMEALV